MDYELKPEETALAGRVEASLGANPDLSAGAARAWLARLGECGYFAAEASQVALLLAGKALATRAPWLVFVAELQRLALELVQTHGAPAQRETFLPSLEAGQRVAAVAFSEPGRSLQAEPACRAEPAGDGYVLSGEKGQVSLAAACDWLAVLAMTPGGPAVLLVERAAPGVALGAPLESFGYAELDGRPASFWQVRVPAGSVLGPLPADRLAVLVAALRRAEDRLATAAGLGLLARCLEEARAAASAPREGGKPAASHQLVRFDLAEMLTQLQTAELLALRAAAAAAGSPEAERLGLCAKVFASEAACRVSDQALGILAAAGYLRTHPVARALAEARLGCLAGHSSHAARMALADDVLARLAPV
jgi:alkylation response protein AidB-like acyl-CoA dehydrogenase